MRSKLSIFMVVLSVLALVAATGAFAAGNRSMGRKGAFSPADERLEGGTLALDMRVSYERAELTLSGPGGVRVKREFAGGEAIALRLIDQAGEPLANGSYRYSLRISPRPENSSAVKSGMFFVRDGAAVSRQTRRAELGQTREALNLTRSERSKQARQGQREVRRQARPGREASGRPPLSERPDNPTAAYNFYYGIGIYDYYNNSPYLAFYIYNNYDYSYYYTGGLLSYAFYYDGYYYGSLSSYGQVFNNVYGGVFTWVSAPYNYIVSPDGLSGPFLYAGYVGVGINTGFPTADLEVYDYESYAAMRLNNGTASWAFSNTPAGVFTVNLIGSGGQEFAVRPRLDAAGNTMQVQGSVQGTTFVASSSRDLKTDFTTLDGQEVLAKLAEIPVMSWRYKTDHEADRHFGPVAEDFQAAFQLGDGKTIANIDADGVALAAIQGLNSLLQERDAELNALRSEVADLRRLLESQHPEH